MKPHLLTFAGLVALLAWSTPIARGDDDEHEEHEEHEREEHERGEARGSGVAARSRAPDGVAPVTLPAWTSECGSCHMAYAPGLLPARSWTTLLDGLGQHFGDDATLPDATRAELLAYATANAADVSSYRLSRSITRVTEGTTPLRISTIPAIRAQHDEIPVAWFSANPDVRSRANCAACHTKVAEGSFREGEIRIPGHGAWDD